MPASEVDLEKTAKERGVPNRIYVPGCPSTSALLSDRPLRRLSSISMRAGLVISVTFGAVLIGLATASAQSPGNVLPPLSGNIPPKITSFTTFPPNGVAPLSVSLSVTALDQDGSIQTVDWDFGDGTQTQTTVLSIDHVYMTTGTFIATVSVKDNQGGSAFAKTTISVPAARTPINSFPYSSHA